MAVAYVLFGRGLLGVGVAAAGTSPLAEPATAAVLGVVVVGERFGGATAAGWCSSAPAGGPGGGWWGPDAAVRT